MNRYFPAQFHSKLVLGWRLIYLNIINRNQSGNGDGKNGQTNIEVLMTTSNRSKKAIQNDTFFARWSREKINTLKKGEHGTKNEGGPNEEFPVTDMRSSHPVSKTTSPVISKEKKEIGEQVFKTLFKKQEFSTLDGLNEYDEDYTSFLPRGDLITQDMLRCLSQIDAETVSTDKYQEHSNDAHLAGEQVLDNEEPSVQNRDDVGDG